MSIKSAISTALTWVETETGIIKQDVIAIEPAVLAVFKNFMSQITPVMTGIAKDAVLAAVSVPGTGLVKAAAAAATVATEFLAQGIPVIDTQIKALVKVVYDSLPATLTGNTAASAVLDKVDSTIDKEAEKISTPATAAHVEAAAATVAAAGNAGTAVDAPAVTGTPAA